MIHRLKSFPISTLTSFQQHFLTKDMLLFDIETTGLSAAKDSIYCIGCGYRMDDKIHTELFFAETPSQEKEILAVFFALLHRFKTIITFNGTSFDIPFIQKRSVLYDELSAWKHVNSQQDFNLTISTGSACTTPESAFISIDLYREAFRMKPLLHLPSYRQKAIEQFLGCTREDRYDGGQLIRIYHRYASSPDSDALSLLLLHNEEDVRGMFGLIGLLSWHQLRDGAFTITDSYEEKNGMNSFYNIKICPDLPFPKTIHNISFTPDEAVSSSVHTSNEYGSLFLEKETGLIRFPVYHGTLKHFYPDPENYVYLPGEDCAVHKSVGAFVDPSHRRKATKKNCYSKQDCDYITAPVKAADCSLRRDFRDTDCYLALPAEDKDKKKFLLWYFSLCF